MSQCTESVHVGILTHRGFSRCGPPRSILGLYPGNVSHDVPVGENPTKVSIFLNQFMNARGNYLANYLATNFRTQGWVSVFKQQWWSSLTLNVLEVFTDDLIGLGFYKAVRATYFGINISIPTFYAILEMYCPVSGIFFTLVGELGMALHEIWEVSNLPMGPLPCEEYFSCA